MCVFMRLCAGLYVCACVCLSVCVHVCEVEEQPEMKGYSPGVTGHHVTPSPASPLDGIHLRSAGIKERSLW